MRHKCGFLNVSTSNTQNFDGIIKFEDIHNSWLYCFTNPLELGIRVSVSHRAKAKHVSQVQEN